MSALNKEDTRNQEELPKLIYDCICVLANAKDLPLRVAINGIEGTGKTYLAKKLTEFLITLGKTAFHISIDGFHFNRAHRYRKGKDSAIGYYEDSYNEKAFLELVLLSSQLSPPKITRATHDLESDEYLSQEPLIIPEDAILIADGAYLFKPVYRSHWDLKIYLKTDFETAAFRGAGRDKDKLGGEKEALMKFKQRYHAASKMYIDQESPEDCAHLVIDYTSFKKFRILKNTLL